jgi:hypothetical protein
MVKEFVLPQFMLGHEHKKAVEERHFSGYEDFLKEKDWEKRSPEDIREIQRAIDEGLERVVPQTGTDVSHTEEARREVVYSNKRGHIVKVTCTENGAQQVSYFLVTQIDDIEEAIDRLTSYRPLIESDGDEETGS